MGTKWGGHQDAKDGGLDVWIQPVIVFTNAFVREWNPVKGILLWSKKYLLRQ